MSDNQADDAATEPAPASVGSPAPAPADLDPAAIGSSPLIDRMGIVILSASPEQLVATMPVEGNTQPFGLLHGGASCVLAETLGSIGAVLHGSRSGKIAVGIDLNATHHRGAKSGLVTATARALHLGSTLASYEIVIIDDRERRICTARLTCMLIPAPTQPDAAATPTGD